MPTRKKDRTKKTTARKESEAARPRDICTAVESSADCVELRGDPASPAGPGSTAGRSDSTGCSSGNPGSFGNQLAPTDGEFPSRSSAKGVGGAGNGCGGASWTACALVIALGAITGATKLAHSSSTSTSGGEISEGREEKTSITPITHPCI